MFNPLNLISKFIKSSNQKELDRIGKIVEKINSLENEFEKLNDIDFPNKTQELKNQIRIGKTLDDSAGEVFDKVARHLGLPYPGGPEISKASSKVRSSSYTFPRPMLNTTCYDFSFSGLKTHITQKINKTNLTDDQISDVAFDFENAILDVLITKTLKASDELNIKDIVVSGGVSANKKLRERFDKEKGSKNIYFPDLAYSTDNGAMIAYMGWLKFSNQNVNSLEINPKPTSSLT